MIIILLSCSKCVARAWQETQTFSLTLTKPPDMLGPANAVHPRLLSGRCSCTQRPHSQGLKSQLFSSYPFPTIVLACIGREKEIWRSFRWKGDIPRFGFEVDSS